MSDPKPGIDRRELIKTGLAVTAGAAVFGAVPRAESALRTSYGTGAMPARVLGRTGVELPMLAFGGVLLTSKWSGGRPFDARVQLARAAYDAGIRYFDTATEYTESEKVLGTALKDVRNEVFLNTKIDVVKPEYVRRTVERSMSEFQVDMIDGVQLHGTPGIEAMTFEGAMAVRDELAKLRDEGMIRYIGLTGHHYFDKMYRLIDTGAFDHVMLAYGYFKKGMWRLLDSRMVELRELCLTRAHELGMGILAMKVMGGSVLAPWSAARLAPDLDAEAVKALPAAAVRWVLQDERIHLLCIGQGSPAEIEANIRTLSGDTSLTTTDRTLLASFSAKAYPAYEKMITARA
jgi:predicted aldo/keto reductase-like oxidoreductase